MVRWLPGVLDKGCLVRAKAFIECDKIFSSDFTIEAESISTSAVPGARGLIANEVVVVSGEVVPGAATCSSPHSSYAKHGPSPASD